MPTNVCRVKAMAFSSSQVQLLDLDHNKVWVLKNWYVWTVVLEKTLWILSTARRSKRKSTLNIHWKDWGWSWSWSSSILATWCEELAYWKRPWCWERLKVGGEGDDRRWDGWMASLTQWTWVWVSSGSWWWTGRPGVLQSMESESDMTEQLNWTVKNAQECLPWQPEKVYKIVHTWWVVNGNDFLSPTSALQICLWAPLSCFYNNILGRCLGLPVLFGYQYNIIFSYSSVAPISKGHFHISKLTTPFLYSSNCDMLDLQWVTTSVSKLLPVYELSPVDPGRQRVTSLLSLSQLPPPRPLITPGCWCSRIRKEQRKVMKGYVLQEMVLLP